MNTMNSMSNKDLKLEIMRLEFKANNKLNIDKMYVGKTRESRAAQGALETLAKVREIIDRRIAGETIPNNHIELELLNMLHDVDDKLKTAERITERYKLQGARSVLRILILDINAANADWLGKRKGK